LYKSCGDPTYRNKPLDARQIGRELGVRYVLEGSVRRSGGQVRVNAQLIDAATDMHLWAERFDRDMGDLFALQNEITHRIAVALNLEMVGREAARPTAHPDKLDYILRGRGAHARPPSRDNRAEAISLFERALALDQQSVAAQSYLATALAARVEGNMTDTAAADLTRAKALAGNALAASPGSPLAHYAKGQVLRALQSRTDDAIIWLERARNATPAHPDIRANLASAYAFKGEAARAAAEFAETRSLSGDDRFSSIARLKAVRDFGVPKIHALFEATYFAGLRKAGMPEE
jgi:adenylate cyclase